MQEEDKVNGESINYKNLQEKLIESFNVTKKQKGIKLFIEEEIYLKENNLGLVELKVFYTEEIYAILPIPLFTLGVKYNETDLDRFNKISEYLSKLDTKYIRSKFKALPEENKEFLSINNEPDERLFISKIKADVTGIQREVSRILKEIMPIISTGKYRKSAHLTDQQLKYFYPKDRNKQLSIFDMLQDKTRGQIEVAGVEVTEIVEGIKLSASETKIIDCLCKLLHENSQKAEKGNEDYYTGNIGYDMVEYGDQKEKTPAPKLAFTLYELTKEYKGGEAVSGKDVENVKQILTELDNKRFLLSYVETTKTKSGGRIERKIEDFKKLLTILQISQTEYNKEDIEINKKEETIILLNPIFRRQIDSKFILYPNDINRRTIIAYGSHNLSEIVLKLREYLMRELSSNHYTPEIYLERLYFMLSDKWMKESRKKKVKEYTDKALETVKAIGLLKEYKIETGKTGEAKMKFILNKDWE